MNFGIYIFIYMYPIVSEITQKHTQKKWEKDIKIKDSTQNLKKYCKVQKNIKEYHIVPKMTKQY